MTSRFRDSPAVASPARPAILLVNLGTPDAPTARAVWRYLAQFLHDYRVVEMSRWLWCPLLHFIILPVRVRAVARKYASIWTSRGSPLRFLSEDLAQAVARRLPGYAVGVAMCYGAPSVAKVLREMHAQGLSQLLVLPLYPQYSASTTAAVHDAVTAELRQWRRVPGLRLIEDYHLDAGWLDALANSVRAHWQAHGRAQKLLLSFHGLPQRFVAAGDPYARQCEASARALAQRLQLDDGQWQLTYQSRFGREAWLQPYTDATLRALAGAGVRNVDLLCPGFAVDCLETLQENAVENAELFREAGGSELRYIPALNASDAHADALAALLQRHLRGLAANDA